MREAEINSFGGSISISISSSSINSSRFKPKSILITGGAGFIGSHLTLYLTNNYKSYHITVLDKLDYCSNLQNLSNVDTLNHSNFKFYKGNILDNTLLEKIFKEENIDTVLHLAASTHVDNSFEDSIKFTENNILGTHYLLECSRRHCIKRFIYISTDEVYGPTSHDQLKGSTESNTILKPTNPYSASKAAAELLVQSYSKSFQLPCIITRGNNVYGPKQYPEKIIPKFLSQLLSNKSCTIHGNGLNVRSYLYVDDVVRAFDIILHNGKDDEIYNIGTDFEISNIQVANTLIEMLYPDVKNKTDFIEFVQDRPFNDQRYYLNSSKLKQLGWKQQVNWNDGLKYTIEWYLQNRNYWDNNKSSNN